MPPHVLDVTQATFDEQVLAASRRVPVLVDFWAPWCGPCRALGPVLEKLAAEFDGRFLLAKVNSDENMQLAAEFGVRGIPNVKAFVDGQLADEFSGALPESAVRRFLEQLLPSPAETLRRQAADQAREGDAAGARALLEHALQAQPEHDRARLDLAELLATDGQADAAERLLDVVRPHIDFQEQLDRVRARIAMLRQSAGAPDASALVQRIAADPGDLASRMALANVLATRRDWDGALAQLLEVVRRDRRFEDGAARKLMVSIFSMAEDAPETVSRYRRELASALY